MVIKTSSYCRAHWQHFIFIVSLLSGAMMFGGCQRADKLNLKTSEVSMVRAGVPVGVVVLSNDTNITLRAAAQEFVKIVARSTGAILPIHVAGDGAIPAKAARLYVGSQDQAALPAETYRIIARDNAVYVMGTDQPSNGRSVASRPTLWALNKLLETQLGVRWLWPGELGTYVPKHHDFSIPVMDITFQPALIARTLRMNISSKGNFAVNDQELDRKLKQEALLWAENHLCGRRGNLRFGHAFGGWWKKYADTQPDLFAEVPAGIKAPYPRAERVKLRLANPDVIEQIAVEYIAAGAPKYYNVCPNDSTGFDVSDATLAWDIPRDQAVKDIFLGRANLTARYVEFWNRLYKRLVVINPEVVLASYAYSAYRAPPPPERPLEARMALGIVDTYNAYDNWKQWADSGAQLYLRPNWWHQGADAPYLSLQKTADFFSFASKNGMIGLDMDSILGYWATQGVNYYLMARLMTNPDLNVDTILDEYAAAFGQGASAIIRYIGYWQRISDEYNYPLNAANEKEELPSKFNDLVKAGKVPGSILSGSTYALPYLYNDAVIAPAEAILTEAEGMIGTADAEALQRVAFLRLGLTSMRATREQIARAQALSDKVNRRNKELIERFKTGALQLDQTRERLAEKHVIWAQNMQKREDRYKIALRPAVLGKKINLDGM